jgi:hypothetical protein
MSKKISQLTELTTVLDSDLLAVVNNGETKKVTKANLLKEITSTSFVDGEIPAGSINGTNTVYTTAFNFITGSTHVFLNGIRIARGSSSDYTETGLNQINFISAPQSGDSILIDYRK